MWNKEGSRLEAIDQFRGFAILLMVLADYLADVRRVPAWLKHSPGVGYTAIDLIAPLFIFAIGLTYKIAIQHRIDRMGWGKTAQNVFKRYMALVGIGFLLTLGGRLSGIYPSAYNWGLLQAIGVAGLLTLPVIRLPSWLRWVIALGLLGAYQPLLVRYWLRMVLNSPHGGLPGSLEWSAMLIMATALADLYHDPNRSRRAFLWVSLLVLVAGIGLAALVPVSKHRVSASYVLISTGASGLVFLLFHWLDERWGFHLRVLSDWGKNPLLLYLLHGVLIGVFALPRILGWYVDAPLWLVPLQAAALIGALSWIGWYFNKREWFVSL